MMRRSAAFLLALALLGGGSAHAAKVLRIGVSAPLVGIDPLSMQDNVSALVVSSVYEPPYVFPPAGGAPVPLAFAGPLEESRDGALFVYTAKVKQGIVFSDGTPLTAALAARSLAKVSLVKTKGTVEARGQEVLFRLKDADRRLAVTLAQRICGLTLEKEGRLLGTGPFVVAPDSTQRATKLLKNPRYRQPVRLDEIRFQVYPPKSDGRLEGLLNAIRRGEVDFTHALSLPDLAALKGAPIAPPSIQPGIATSLLFFQSERLKELKVRQALAHAVNRAAIAREVLGRDGFAATSLLPPAMGKEADGLEYDPERARKLLAEAGSDAPTSLTLLETWTARPYAPNPRLMCERIAQDIEKLGIKVRIVPGGGASSYFDKLAAGEFDMALGGWIADTPDPVDFLDSNLASWKIPPVPNDCESCNNNARIRSKAVDAALARFTRSTTPETRRAVIDAAGDEAPFVPILWGPDVYVVGKRVKGFVANPFVVSFAGVDVTAE